MHLPGFYHLVQLRVEWISLHIHNVYPIRTQAWDNQPAPRSGGVIITRTASIPSHVVYLISKVRKVKTRYHCRVGWTVRVNIHSCNIVRIVLTRYNAREVQDLLSRGGEEGISWCGITRSTSTTRSHFNQLVTSLSISVYLYFNQWSSLFPSL